MITLEKKVKKNKILQIAVLQMMKIVEKMIMEMMIVRMMEMVMETGMKMEVNRRVVTSMINMKIVIIKHRKKKNELIMKFKFRNKIKITNLRYFIALLIDQSCANFFMNNIEV